MSDDRAWPGEGAEHGVVDHNTLTQAVRHMKSEMADMCQRLEARIAAMEGRRPAPAPEPKSDLPHKAPVSKSVS